MSAKKTIVIVIPVFLLLHTIFSFSQKNNEGSLPAEKITTRHPISANQLVANIKNKTYSGESRNFILKDSPFKELVLGLSEFSGINMVIDPGISGTISCYLKQVPWDQALAVFLKQYNLTVVAEENIIRIRKKEAFVFFKSLFFKVLVFGILLIIGLIILLIIYKHKSPTKANEQKKTALNPHFAREYANKLIHLLETKKVFRSENLTIQSLAQHLSIPAYQLSRIINEHMKQTFSELINHYRIEEAKKLLAVSQESEQKILDIAYDVGFSTKTSFNKVFKKHTRMTPSEFIKKQTGPCRGPNF